MTPATHTNVRRAHAVSAGCLASERSREARAAHAATVHAFVAAGAAHLLRGPTWRKAAIIATYLRLVPEASAAEEWDHADVRAQSFARFVKRNAVWVAAVAEGTS